MKKTITTHMKLTKAQRQSHTNPFSDCIPATYSKDTPNGKKGTHTTPNHGTCLAKKNLLEYHNIEKFDGNVHKVHTCHLCSNHSQAPNGFVCINPLHLYFGTVSENTMDKTPEQRKAGAAKALENGNHISKNKEACAKGGKIGGKKGVAKALKNGNHISHKEATCPHCGKTGKYAPMMQWHFDRCKHKP